MLIHHGPSSRPELSPTDLPGPADEPTVTVLISVGFNLPTGGILHGGHRANIRAWLSGRYNGIDDGSWDIRGTLLATFNGEGIWEGEREGCAAALWSLPLSEVVRLRDECLPVRARDWSQESIGFVCHDSDIHPVSYVSGEDQ